MSTNFISRSLGLLSPSASTEVSIAEVRQIALHGQSVLDSQAKAGNPAFSAGIASRPELPPAQDEERDYLQALAKAFCDAYGVMSQTTQQQTSDLTTLQTLDQSMSQAVLETTETSIEKEKTIYQKQLQIQQYMTQESQEQNVSSIIGWVVGGLLIALTVASAFIDMGASLAAVPEEVAAVAEDGASGLVDGLEGEGTEMTDMSAEDETEGTSETTDTEQDANVNNDENSVQQSENVTEDQANESTEKDSETSNKEDTKSMNNWQKAQKALSNRFFKMGVSVTTSLALGIPDILTGITQMKMGQYQDQLGEAQRVLGHALATAQKNNYFFQFYQQLIQRESGVVQQTVSQLTDVLEIASQVMSAYRQIPYGLAQAV